MSEVSNHPANQSCLNCYYYVNGSNTPGMCQFTFPFQRGVWPTVQPTDWCGEWSLDGLPTPPLIAAWRVLTDIDGVAVLEFPDAFDYAPTVTATAEHDGDFPLMATVIDVSETSASVRVWAGRALPGFVPGVLNYDVFAGTPIAGVAAHIVAIGNQDA